MTCYCAENLLVTVPREDVHDTTVLQYQVQEKLVIVSCALMLIPHRSSCPMQVSEDAFVFLRNRESNTM